MTLDIRGSLKNTKLSTNKYVVVEELISNSIDSFLIRQNQDPQPRDLRVTVSLAVSAADLLGDQLDLSITCTDNGCGLGDEQADAFLTKDTSYKDDLTIAGIGKCKGAGRIQYFHHFGKVGLSSTYRAGDTVLKRTLEAVEGRKKIDLADLDVTAGAEADIGTSMRLSHLRPAVQDRFFKAEPLSEIFSAANVRRHMLVAFLQRLVSLKASLGDFDITFAYSGPKDERDTSHLRAADLPSVTASQVVEVEHQDRQTGEGLKRFELLQLSHYKLDAKLFDLPKNSISLCAKSSPAQDITGEYLRTRAEQNNAVGGFHHIVLVEGAFLDRCVNEQRDGFEGIPKEIPSNDLFADETVSFDAIHEKIDPIIEAWVSPSGWSRDGVLKDVTDKFGVSSAMLQDTETRIRHGDSPKSVAERVLKKYQDRVLNDTVEIVDLKEEILKAQPDSADYRKKIHELTWRYTASLKSFDMANLSQLVVRRAAIVEILSLACGKKLHAQADAGAGARRNDEQIIHSIFFPMKKDSLEVVDHDIWLLSEEYQYYNYIASDKALSKIRWIGDEELFDPSIDAEFQALLAKRSGDNAAKRPDIAIFSKEGSAIIIEFKAPGVSMDEHIGDLSEYAHLLAAKSNGRLKKFYGYLIGDTINPLRMQGWTRFPSGKGYFRSSPLLDPEGYRGLGELYEETLYFEDVVERARQRISVYKDRLQVNLSS